MSAIPKWLDPASREAIALRSFRHRLRAGFRGSLAELTRQMEKRDGEREDAKQKAIKEAEREKSVWIERAQADFERALGVLSECRFEREVGFGGERVLTVRLAVSNEMLYRARHDGLMPLFGQMLGRMVEKEVVKAGDEMRKEALRVMQGPRITDLTRALSEHPTTHPNAGESE